MLTMPKRKSGDIFDVFLSQVQRCTSKVINLALNLNFKFRLHLLGVLINRGLHAGIIQSTFFSLTLPDYFTFARFTSNFKSRFNSHAMFSFSSLRTYHQHTEKKCFCYGNKIRDIFFLLQSKILLQQPNILLL